MAEKDSKKTAKKGGIKPERRDNYTWKKGDLKVFASKEEIEKHAKENNEKIIWY